jgi:hypothetical protein
MPVGVAWISPSAAGDVIQRADARIQALRERRRALVVGVDDRQFPDAERPGRVRDGRARPTGAQQHHALARDIRQPAGEALGEARRVRVVADRPPVAHHDGVHGVELRRRRRELVEVVDDLALARVRDVEPAPALLPGRLQEVLRLGAELVDVQQPVLVGHALARRLALVQRGAQRRADARADQPDQMLIPTPPLE